MNIGGLDKNVTVFKRTETPDGTVLINETLITPIAVWAKIEAVGNAIFWGSKQIENAITHRITMRKQTGITEELLTGEYIIKHGTSQYRIKRVFPEKINENYLVAECERLN